MFLNHLKCKTLSQVFGGVIPDEFNPEKELKPLSKNGDLPVLYTISAMLVIVTYGVKQWETPVLLQTLLPSML